MSDQTIESVNKLANDTSFVVDIGFHEESSTLRYVHLRPNGSGDDVLDIEARRKEKEAREISGFESFSELLDSWAQSCLGFLDSFPMFLSVAHFVNHGVSSKEIMALLEKESIHKENLTASEEDLVCSRYSLGRQHLDAVYRKIKRKNQSDRAEDAFSKAQLLAIVAEYEAFIADLLRLSIKETPDSFILSSQTVSASSIIRSQNIDELKKTIIEDHIIDCQRGSHVDVIKNIFKQLKLSTPDEEALREFGEICLRRNTLTHANGVSNKVYRSDMKKLGFAEEKIPSEGTKLHIDNHYMQKAISRVFQMGYFTAHLVWQHLKKDERDVSVKQIINHSHDFLVSGYTKVCGRLCDFGLHSKSPAGQRDRAYLTINLALSFLLNEQLDPQKQKTEVKKALSKRDWSIVDAQFAMALCCINEDYEKFGELFDETKDKHFDLNSFMSFAIFSKVRNQPIFKEKMLEHYGIEVSVDDDQEEIMRKEE